MQRIVSWSGVVVVVVSVFLSLPRVVGTARVRSHILPER